MSIGFLKEVLQEATDQPWSEAIILPVDHPVITSVSGKVKAQSGTTSLTLDSTRIAVGPYTWDGVDYPQAIIINTSAQDMSALTAGAYDLEIKYDHEGGADQIRGTVTLRSGL